MSDSQIVFVDQSVHSRQEAVARAGDIRGWLLDEQIIIDERGEPPWYPEADHPGPRWASTVGGADRGHPPSGVEISTTASVFNGVENVGDAATCPRCGVVLEIVDWIAAADDMLTEWVRGSGVDDMPCPSCASPLRVSQWRWDSGEPWALGYLGVVFWNWPPLSEEFVAELTRRLGDGADVCVIDVHI